MPRVQNCSWNGLQIHLQFMLPWWPLLGLLYWCPIFKSSYCKSLNIGYPSMKSMCTHRADSRFAPSQWETSLQSNAISHWLRANLESVLYPVLKMSCSDLTRMIWYQNSSADNGCQATGPVIDLWTCPSLLPDKRPHDELSELVRFSSDQWLSARLQ